jgi:hypothetical protein
MGDTECFVKIQMADVRADVPWSTEPYLCVHIRTVHIDLPAVRMNDLTDAPYVCLEDTVRRGVGQHERGQPITMLSGLGFKIGDIHVALSIAGDRHNRHTHHRRTGRIRAVRGQGNQAHIPMLFTLASVVRPN